MKRLVLLISALTIGYANVSAESCLPQGITFTHQVQIDNFTINYPECTEIEGSVLIQGDDIANLNGLSVLTSISGDLSIFSNLLLTGLAGLEGLNSIGGNFQMAYNYSLTGLLGLKSLTSVGGDIRINNNKLLTSLNGLEGVNNIGGNLDISSNSALISLEGLDGLIYIGGDLKIIKNSSLSTCHPGWLCDYLVAPDGKVFIYKNATGCNLIDIAHACGGLPCLPFGDYYLYTQSDIDNFLQAFPACFELDGEVTINGQDITNLNGLSHITSVNNDLLIFYASNLTTLAGLDNLAYIGGNFLIFSNFSLTSLTGLDNLASIGGDLWFSPNSSLASLTGLDNLTTVGGNLRIASNSPLNNLSGLNNLTSVGDGLSIISNPSLTSLTGLDNLTTIGGALNINGNSLLTTCDVEWLCDYLSAPDGPVKIFNNASGCDLIEIAYACGGLPCLPYGEYYFNTQSAIDNFLLAFPHCNEIAGSVNIKGNNITNLNGLSHIASIGGNLEITSNPSLVSLAGLEGLNFIGGNLRVSANTALVNVSGLESLTAIGGDFRIASNPSLTSMAGLANLTSIGGSFNLTSSSSITNLTGLENLTTIGSDFSIVSNSSLINLNGLGGLSSIGGNFRITSTKLNNLAGMNNLTSIGGVVEIMFNSSLSACEEQWLCNYLAAPGGTVKIYNNAPGCDLMEIAYECGGLPCLPNGDYYFYTQSDIDLFQQAFPGCYALEGNVIINGADNITDLNGLNQVTSIGGSLEIYNLQTVTSLSGLDNLTSIGDSLIIATNSSLLNLNGLDNLSSVGGPIEIRQNSSLNTLTGLDGLTSIGLYLHISGNHALTSLTGIDNINAGSILYMVIRANSSLSDCAVQSVCDFIVTPNAIILNYSNATGCNSLSELMEACKSIGIAETVFETGYIVFPNPFNESLSVEFTLDKVCRVSMTVFNNMGQVVARPVDRQLQPGVNRLFWESSSLPPGLYFLHLQVGSKMVTKKIVKY